MNGWSIGCWRAPVTASAGPSTGWTWRTMPTRTASSSTPNGPMPGAIATGWFARSNADLPYDRFVALQIAGDELNPGDRAALIATGFGRCGPREVVGGNVIPEVKRQNELTEITGTVGSVFLGLTIGCARCHDHKFDAIPTTDYYRLQSFFAASELVDLPIAEQVRDRRHSRPPRRPSSRRPRRFAHSSPHWRPLIANGCAEQKHAMLTADEARGDGDPGRPSALPNRNAWFRDWNRRCG